MDEIDALDKIDAILATLPEDSSVNPADLIEKGFRLTGALLVGQYVGPDGRSSALIPTGIGNMNAWTQEGIHLWALRRLASGDYVSADADTD